MNNRAYNRDCLEAMREMDDNQFDLAIVDPPYGIGETGLRSARTARRINERWNNRIAKVYEMKEWDTAPQTEYFKELFRVSREQIIWGANHFISHMPFDSASWIVWDKKASGDFSDGELAWCSVGGSVRVFEWLWNGFRKQEPEDRFHPTQKPVALYKWLLTTYAKQGDSILDTHLGSGSSRIAAYDLGFDFTGYELDKDYFEAQEQRFANHIAQPKLFEPRIVEHQEALFAA